MNTIDDLITSVLQDLAKDAPDADGFVNRVLGEMEPVRTPRVKPRWDLSVPVWTVPMTAAAVAALIVLATVLSSVWLNTGGWNNGGVTTPPTTTTPAPDTDSTPTLDHTGRLPGWLELSSGPVHIEMNADASDQTWSIGCSLSVLSMVETGDFACAGQAGQQPSYEVMVGPGMAPANLANNSHLILDRGLQPGALPGNLSSDSVAGSKAHTLTTTAQVRYDCPGSCGKDVERDVTVIGFPEQDTHITILSPVGDNRAWLTDYIYIEPTGRVEPSNPHSAQ